MLLPEHSKCSAVSAPVAPKTKTVAFAKELLAALAVQKGHHHVAAALIALTLALALTPTICSEMTSGNTQDATCPNDFQSPSAQDITVGTGS